jgi:hypothetical protein
MSRYISDVLRAEVTERANYCCEYCRLPLRFSFFRFQIDHIVSLKHGGKTVSENLALACGFCNTNKGADLGTFLNSPKELVPFFNPREDDWHTNFEFDRATIVAKTEVGAATIKIFGFNEIERLMERQILINAGLYPI